MSILFVAAVVAAFVVTYNENLNHKNQEQKNDQFIAACLTSFLTGGVLLTAALISTVPFASAFLLGIGAFGGATIYRNELVEGFKMYRDRLTADEKKQITDKTGKSKF